VLLFVTDRETEIKKRTSTPSMEMRTLVLSPNQWVFYKLGLSQLMCYDTTTGGVIDVLNQNLKHRYALYVRGLGGFKVLCSLLTFSVSINVSESLTF
jgi:hypothetical protein